MPKKEKGELPSGSIRRQVYDHSEPIFKTWDACNRLKDRQAEEA